MNLARSAWLANRVIDHVRHIAYMHRMGFYTLKEFDFPHKRAALTVLERQTFFDTFKF